MAADVLDALPLQLGQALGVEHQLQEFVVDTLVGGLDVDDGTELGLAEYLVVLGLAATDADDALRHGQQGVHGGGVAVELVEQDVGVVHQLLILDKGHALGLAQLDAVGVAGGNVLGGAQHDVGTLVGGTAAADADEDSNGRLRSGGRRIGRRLPGGSNPDGQGDEVGLLGEVALVADVVLVEAGNDGVAVVGYQAVQPLLGRCQPVGALLLGHGVGAYGVADVEVAVAHGALVGVDADPVVVHAEGAEYHAAIVAAQVAVEGEEPLGAQLEEDGVDELYDIVAAEARQ